MLRPLLTVIMPSYNAEPFIAESIVSVLAQTVEDWELIVVDDASGDGTLDIVAEFQRRDQRIRLVAEGANHGPAHARNRGLEQARGDLIAFIDSDDVWFPEKTAKQLAAMEHYQADISYTGYKRRRDDEQDGTVVAVPPSVTYEAMLRRNLIGCSTSMVRRSTCGTLRMSPIMRRQEDHCYWLSLLRDGSRTAIGVNQPLVWYRLHHGSLSANKLVSATYSWKLLRQVERFGLAKSLWIFSGYAFQALKLRLPSFHR